MNFRHYDLKTYGILDLELLEDRLHTFIHIENVVRRDEEEQSKDFDRRLANGDSSEEPGDSTSTGLVHVPKGNGELYNVLALNEFDVVDKQVRRTRFFPRQYGVFGKRIPTHKASVLLSGEHQPLIAIHHYLVTDLKYLVKSARDVTQANWSGRTYSQYNYGFQKSWDELVLNMINEDFSGITATSRTYNTKGNPPHHSEISVRGPIESVIKLRDFLQAGFEGAKVLKNQQILSYS